MPANIEIKARLRDVDAVRRRAEPLASGRPEVLQQVDTFFRAPHGRLKLRQFPDGSGELIHYHRHDVAGPKESRYTIAPVDDAGPLGEALAGALGVRCIVRKTRTLLLSGQTRIHLDEVETLGDFVELEVVLRPGQRADEGNRIARELMGRLGIEESDLVPGAYADLLEPREGAPAASGAEDSPATHGRRRV